jgi:hypothetical protein
MHVGVVRELAATTYWAAALALLLLCGCESGHPGRATTSAGAADGHPASAVSAGVVVSEPHIATLPGTTFDASSADRIARTARYGAWVRLPDEHVLDLAVWPNQEAAKHAVRRYNGGGLDTRPAPSAYSHVLRRIDRIRNVTLAWYYRPTKSDQRTVRGALHFGPAYSRGHQYVGVWAISGATMDPYEADGDLQEYAKFAQDIVLVGGCNATIGCGAPGGGCAPTGGWNDISVGIFGSAAAAETFISEEKDALSSGERLERVRNAAIDWRCRATKADEAVVRAALH